MEKLSLKFKLPVFEGPLDALLYLISKHKLNIYDIEISELLEQYLEYLSQLTSMDLEVTSEFLEMASRLVQIKSSMLLPRYEDQKEDPRSELMTALIEYQTCKEMAMQLSGMNQGFGCFVRQPQEIEHDATYRRIHSPQELIAAFSAIAGRMKNKLPPTPESFRGIVGRRVVSVAARVVHIIRSLYREGRKSFHSLFEDAGGRSEAVATFLAVLELVKSRKIVVLEDENGEQMVSCAGSKRRVHARSAGPGDATESFPRR